MNNGTDFKNSSLVGNTFNFIYNVWFFIKDNKSMKLSILSLIRSQIVGKCEKYIKEGVLPEYARYCLEDLFKQYKALGGNHGIEILVKKCFELPPIERSEKK